MTHRPRRLTPLAVALLAAGFAAALASPVFLDAQERTATVVAGEGYRAGALKRFLLGREYRNLWTAPIRVEVLDLSTYAGGLTPTEAGGGNQTLSLRFRGADGREYAFRSVDKEPGRENRRDMQGTLVGGVLKDQVSSLVPAGPVMADPILDAAGVLHPSARLYVMPDDPRLGEHRKEFAGMLGTLEERPETGRTGIPGLAGAVEMVATDSFFKLLVSGAEQRVASREYLRVRLVDLFLNDWDRHEDQYRWARFDSGGVRLWRPVPRDRDYVFADYDGFLLGLARSAIPNAVRFRGTYDLGGLLYNGRRMDRYLLGDLPRAAWDSVVADLQARLTDRVISEAVRRLPPEYVALEGRDLESTLRERRGNLDDAAAGFYAQTAREAEAHARNSADYAAVERLADGGVEVRISGGGPEGPVYFRRRFVPDETREVRIYLKGGADRARVSGTGPEEVIVRVMGGAGDDDLSDETRTGRRVAFYDPEGENRYTRREGTKVDERAWEEFAPSEERPRPPREWGMSSSSFTPTAGWRSGVGIVVGGGPTRTRYGFRRQPYANQQSLTFLAAPLETRFGAEYRGEWRFVNSYDRVELIAQATQLEAIHFRGFGNDTPEGDSDGTRMFERQLLVEPTYRLGMGPQVALTFTGTARWSNPEPEAGTPAAVLDPPGTRSFGLAGARAGLHVDTRDSTTTYPRSGFTLDAVAGGYPLVGGDAETFADLRVQARTYLSAGRAGPTLALRAGGARVWGDEFPVQYAAFLGGRRSLRGFSGYRFAGDAMAFGGAELRQVLTRANLGLRGDLGVFAGADAGRVWVDGVSDGDLHTSVGGGLFFSVLDRARTFSLSYVSGERGRVYFLFGMPF